jgi:hypothetical protein
MSAERKRTLTHAVLAAAALAVVGTMLAELAGMWALGQTVPRDGPPPTTPPPDYTGSLRWRLPLAMAAAGFVLVLAGEWLTSRWWKPKAAAAEPEKRDFDREAEAKIQAMLKEAEAKVAAADKTTGERPGVSRR